MGEPKLLPSQYDTHVIRSIIDRNKPGTKIDRVSKLIGYVATVADDTLRHEGVNIKDPFITYRNYLLQKHDKWIKDHQPDIERISTQSLTDEQSELSFLHEDTLEFENSIILKLSKRALRAFPFARETHMADVAIRMMFLEAKSEYLDDRPPPYEP